MITIRFSGRVPSPRAVSIGQETDSRADTLRFILPEIADGQEATLQMILPDGTPDTVLIQDGMITIPARMTEIAGRTRAWVEILAGDVIAWHSEILYLEVGELPPISERTEQEYPTAFQQVIAQSLANKNAAQAAQTAAEAAQTAAENAAAGAAQDVRDALEDLAEDAAASATQAAGSATQAAGSAEQAAGSASSAAGSAAAAAGSAGSAEGYASAAAGSANDAESSAAAAAQSAREAEAAAHITIDQTPRAGSANPVASGGVYNALATKQDALTFDNVPTENSNNPVKSRGIKEALDGKKNTQTAVSPPTASGNALAFIDTISQNEQGVIAATKKSVTVDATPTANSTNPVQSSGIKEGLDKKLNTIGKGVNLLDNWYFIGGGSQQGGRKFPINQRGQTEYNSTGYAIDRWRVPPNGNAGSIQLNSSYLSLKKTWFYFEQFLTTPILSNNVYTISVLTDSGLYSKSGKPTFTLNLVGSAIITVTSGGVSLNMQSLTSLNIIATKLELGDTQTLAHQEDGEWVLNDPPPDYNMELLKCQTSTADSGDTYANKQLIPAEHNAGAHNAIYRGKYLGNAVTAAQYAAISAGTFNDLFIGDYWTINGVNWRIAAFDYWLHTGDTECTTHHVVIVPDTALVSGKMNSTTIVTGAYVGSDFYTGNNNNTAKASAKTIIEAAFTAGHILTHREYLMNAVKSGTGRCSAGSWYNSTIELMNEPMVYGGFIFDASSPDGTTEPWNGDFRRYTIDKSQLPLFAHDPSRICTRGNWRLRDPVSTVSFACVQDSGYADSDAANVAKGIRPAFGIVG